MSLLPDNGIIEYNGYRFGTDTHTLGVSVRPVYDRAGRTVTHSIFDLSVRTVLSGYQIDSAVRTIVRLLSKPAAPLVYSGRGLPLTINVSGVRDVIWGPKPQMVDIKPLGGGNAVELTWRVEVAIPDCKDAVYQKSIAEMNFTMTFSVDPAGYTQRSYDGFVRIPMTRITPKDRRLPDSADLYREEINPPLLPGFRRTPGTFTISEDKCTLTFSIRDEQLPANVPPPGIINAQADHSLSSTPGKLVEWTGTLNASYEIARNGTAKPSDARDAFFALLKDRIGHTLASVPKEKSSDLKTPGASGENKKSTVVPISFSMSEPNIYGPTICRYSCVYRVMGASLRVMLQASGLWRPADRDWTKWVASIGPLVLGPRGHANLVFSPQDDTIIDLCGPPGYAELTTGAGRRLSPLLDIPEDTFPEPEPESSWLGYENAVYLEVNNNITPLVRLPAKVPDPKDDVFGKLPNVPPPPGAFDAGKAKGPPLIYDYVPPPPEPKVKKKAATVQRNTQTACLVMIGKAARVRYAIPTPVLDKWGDRKLVPANRPDRGEGFWAGIVGNVGFPVIAARWRLRYFAAGGPPGDNIPVPPNPFDGAPK